MRFCTALLMTALLSSCSESPEHVARREAAEQANAALDAQVYKERSLANGCGERGFYFERRRTCQDDCRETFLTKCVCFTTEKLRCNPEGMEGKAQ